MTHDELPSRRPDVARHVHIVLLGLMGSGKTTVGRIVANELGVPFVDSDALVALESGRSSRQLAIDSGPEALHRVEEQIARDVLESSNPVLFAAAASVVDRLSPSDLERAWTVWLDTSPEVLVDRVGRDAERPLLGTDARGILEQQHRERSARARDLADMVVVTDRRSPSEVAAAVSAAWRDLAGAPADRPFDGDRGGRAESETTTAKEPTE